MKAYYYAVFNNSVYALLTSVAGCRGQSETSQTSRECLEMLINKNKMVQVETSFLQLTLDEEHRLQCAELTSVWFLMIPV